MGRAARSGAHCERFGVDNSLGGKAEAEQVRRLLDKSRLSPEGAGEAAMVGVVAVVSFLLDPMWPMRGQEARSTPGF